MAYDYTQKVEAISAIQFNGGSIPGDAPAWFDDMNTVSGPIYYPVPGGSLQVQQSIFDSNTGTAIPPVTVNDTDWIIKHDDDSLEVLDNDTFVKKYVETP